MESAEQGRTHRRGVAPDFAVLVEDAAAALTDSQGLG